MISTLWRGPTYVQKAWTSGLSRQSAFRTTVLRASALPGGTPKMPVLGAAMWLRVFLVPLSAPTTPLPTDTCWTPLSAPTDLQSLAATTASRHSGRWDSVGTYIRRAGLTAP